MRIAVDALGGDNAPREVVAGALAAAGRLAQDEIFLVGDRPVVEPEVRTDVPPNVSLRNSGGAVGMHEEPAAALRSRPDASISVAAEMVRAGEAEALFSAGNTGAGNRFGAAVSSSGVAPRRRGYGLVQAAGSLEFRYSWGRVCTALL